MDLSKPTISPPLRIDFVAPSSLLREQHRPSMLPVVGNGPPGTFVVFSTGLRVSLPTDQIVWTNADKGFASVGFGGMRFVGQDHHSLLFVRVRELFPEEKLSPDRSHTMRLESNWVTAIWADGRPLWPHGETNTKA